MTDRETLLTYRIKQAEETLRDAEAMAKGGRNMSMKNEKFPHACFHAQQAGEKALKAVWYYADADPWGHSIRKLIEDLESKDDDD